MPDDETVEQTPSDPSAATAEAESLVTPVTPAVPDSVLLASVPLAREALLEITPAATVGDPVGHFVEGEHVLSLLFACTLPGYPGWHWTVTISRIDDESAPSVLEAELMPGDRSLLAPDWVPWSERLADYQASQEAQHAAAAAEGDESESDDESDESDDDDLDDDESDFDDDDDDDVDDDDDDDDDDDRDVHDLHPDDIDGIDIDSADGSYDDEADADADLDLDLDLPAEEAAALDDASAVSAGLAPFDGEIDEPDEAEHETDDDGPEPPAVAGADERAVEDEHHDEGDQPQR